MSEEEQAPAEVTQEEEAAPPAQENVEDTEAAPKTTTEQKEEETVADENKTSETAPAGDTEVKEGVEVKETEQPKTPENGEDKSAVVADEVKDASEEVTAADGPEVPTEAEQPPLQTSEGFTDGEAPEEPPVVGEVLSRGATPPLIVEPDGLNGEEMPQPGTPEKYGSEGGEMELLLEEDEQILMPQYNREELLQKYQAALNEREMLNQQNHQLQHKLAEYFRKKKTEETRQEVDKNVTDQEQRYMKYMSNLEELRQQQTAEQEAYNEQLEELKARKAEKHGKVEEEWNKAIEFKRSVASIAINSRSGRPIQQKDIEMYEANERKKEVEVSQVRLENIKLKNRLRKQEMQLKQKEELAEGLHLIDFEQLKIENQTYNEKIEERNEELLKLRKKITSTVQVLTHLKEKLQFVQAENQVRKSQLAEVEQDVAQKRDILSRTKQARDGLRHDNGKLQQKSGLLGNTDLLRDFEVGSDQAQELGFQLEQLKRQHAELTLSLNGVKKKIELSKENQT
nr:coiled-coil domain-containing protein 96 isoform X2 [Ciona intestinalis]|eukprot:XP_002126679.1 coiled-coil domain-containing protein 96 isoform X2 [Ciona intestinalis]